MNEIKQDFERAKQVMRNAYDAYSHFKVGTVLTTQSGKKYGGCNVANHGIQSICGERVAFVKAISEGERAFSRIVIVGGKSEKDLQECLPCGYCRQFMSEFVTEDFKIYTLERNGNIKEYTLKELLPHRFEI